MADESHVAAGGLFDSLKTLSASLAGLVQTRLLLLATDIAEERVYLTRLLVLGLLALFCFGMGVVLLVMLIVVVFWDTYRLAALGGLTGFFLVASAGLVGVALHQARNRPRLFEASLAELAKDRQHLSAGP